MIGEIEFILEIIINFRQVMEAGAYLHMTNVLTSSRNRVQRWLFMFLIIHRTALHIIKFLF